jgi:hypothetical protein
MQKKRVFWGVIGAMLIVGFMFAGCVSFDKRLMDPDVPVNDHAVLYFDSAMNKVTIDGDKTKGGYHSPLIVYDAMVMLSPGPHTINTRYAKRVESGNYYVDTSTGFLTMTHDFQAGHYYYMYGDESGSQIEFKIIEDANPSHIKKAEKKKKSVTYPKKIAPAVTNGKLLQEAINAAPTKFEGGWLEEGKGFVSVLGPTGAVAYGFEGNVYYYINDTKLLSNWAGTGRDPSEVGTFEYTDTAIIITPLKKRKVGLLSFKSVLENVKPKKTEYAYTLNGDTLVLSLKGKPIGTFVKMDLD